MFFSFLFKFYLGNDTFLLWELQGYFWGVPAGMDLELRAAISSVSMRFRHRFGAPDSDFIGFSLIFLRFCMILEVLQGSARGGSENHKKVLDFFFSFLFKFYLGNDAFLLGELQGYFWGVPADDAVMTVMML